MRLLASLFAVILLLSGLPLKAEVVTDLYRVREPVSGPEDRAQAMQRALDTLVLRLTGSQAALRSPAIAELRKDPQQLAAGYGYEGNYLVVDFDPLITERNLRRARLSLWGANRPLLLIWWLNEADGTDGVATLVGDHHSDAQLVQAAAQNRGLPVRLPLADLQEQLAASSEALTANQPDALQAVSQRYGADGILAVIVRSDQGKWQAQWRLWLGDSREQGSVAAADPAALADAVMLAVSTQLAPRFVVAPGTAEKLTLRVQGANMVRFAELERLLQPFDARLKTVQGDSLSYRLNASPEQLRAQLAIGGMQEVTSVAPEPEVLDAPGSLSGVVPGDPMQNVLIFSWQ